jgi:two-component system cell cycle response regulator
LDPSVATRQAFEVILDGPSGVIKRRCSDTQERQDQPWTTYWLGLVCHHPGFGARPDPHGAQEAVYLRRAARLRPRAAGLGTVPCRPGAVSSWPARFRRFRVSALKSPTVRPIARAMQSTPRILVAEDSRSQRTLVVGLLRREGFEVHEAADGRVALDLCRIARPDLLLLDLALPQLQGWEVLARVRSDSKLRTMPIIVMTADTQSNTVSAVLDGGATDYVAKPAQPDELLARIRRALREKTRLDQLVCHNRVLSDAAELDDLTGLPNRRACADALTLAAGLAEELRRPLSIALVDVDHFKAINDSYGHPVGDQVLRVLARRFRERMLSVELVGRWGGEEFLAVLPEAGPSRAA